MAKSKAKKETSAETVAPPSGGKFARLQPVTLPSHKFEDGTTRYFKLLGPIHVGSNDTERKNKEGEVQKPANVCDSVDIETGVRGHLVVGDVLKNELEKAFPDEGYVGKSFEMSKTKVEGKRYRNYAVFEIDPDKAGKA